MSTLNEMIILLYVLFINMIIIL